MLEDEVKLYDLIKKEAVNGNVFAAMWLLEKMEQTKGVQPLAYEEIIAARLNNYERLLEDKINVVWKGDNYEFVNVNNKTNSATTNITADDDIVLVFNTYILTDDLDNQ